MLTRREALAATALAALFVAASARAQDRLNVIASFSILGDFVKNVGGDRVEVATLVGPNGNAHVYAPSPGDAKKVADAKLVFVNGLGLEGWLEGLVKASGTKAPIVVGTKGIKPLERAGEHGHDHDHGRADPHAWQSVANAKIYVANIRDALIAADPAGKDAYLANAAAYLAKLDALERDVREVVAKIPPDPAAPPPPRAGTPPAQRRRPPSPSSTHSGATCARWSQKFPPIAAASSPATAPSAISRMRMA